MTNIGLTACVDCEVLFEAAEEMIRFSNGHAARWICIDCHDKRTWEWKTR